eukprot:scaffold278_cov194-Alexandrium_tamarense.AAC.6
MKHERQPMQMGRASLIPGPFTTACARNLLRKAKLSMKHQQSPATTALSNVIVYLCQSTTPPFTFPAVRNLEQRRGYRPSDTEPYGWPPAHKPGRGRRYPRAILPPELRHSLL